MARRSGVSGVSKVRRILRDLPKAQTSEVREAIAAGGGIVLRDALGRVPRDEGDLAGELRMLLSTDGLTARVGIIGARSRKKAFHARFIEYGTQAHSLDKGMRLGGKGKGGNMSGAVAKTALVDGSKVHPGTPAKPFLFPALEGNMHRISRLVDAAVDRALRAAVDAGRKEPDR